jgi:hypothetical protein
MRTSQDEILGDNPAFKALKFYYESYYNNLWGPYGPRDSFDNQGQFNSNYLGIDIGPEVLMIENYRSGLLWEKFMNNEKIKAATGKVFVRGSELPPAKVLYVNVANASDQNQDGSQAHPFGNIQRAIDIGGSNSVINIAPGRYSENVNIIMKLKVTLRGVINDRNNPLNFASNTVIFNNDTAKGSWILVTASKDVIVDSVVLTNPSPGGIIWKHAIGIGDSDNIAIKNNIVTEFGACWYYLPGCITSGNSTNVLIDGNRLINNEGYLAGGIYISRSNASSGSLDAVVTNNIISDNRGWLSGGAISVSNATAIVKNNKLSKNTSDGSISIFFGNAHGELKNNLMANNSRGYYYGLDSSAIRCSDSDVIIANNTAYVNSGGPSIYVTGSIVPIIKNNILGEILYEGDTPPVPMYNDIIGAISGCNPGIGSISEDPLFVAPDVDEDPDNDDYHLQPFSPCINAGDPNPVFNDKDGTRNDMGAYGGADSADPTPRFLDVPQDYPTIQSAIDSAADGDVVKVAAGTYDESVNLNKSGVTLLGDGHNSIIEGDPGLPAVYCEDITSKMTLIANFTIRGSSGVRCAGNVDSLRIENNAISVSADPVNYGYGVYMESGGSSYVAGNFIANCGRAIYGEGNNILWIVDNKIDSCRMPGGGGVCLNGPANGPNATIKRNEISRCLDGAINLYNDACGTVVNNIITNNDSTDGAAAIKVIDSHMDLYNNVIAYNHATGNGHSGVIIDGAGRFNNISNYLLNNLFYMNDGTSRPGTASAISMWGASNALYNNIFVGNSKADAVIYSNGVGMHSFYNNDMWSNTCTQDTIGLWEMGNNISDDPLFISSSDFHLSPGSPCIDTGNDDVWHKDSDGTRADMGIYGGPTPMPE